MLRSPREIKREKNKRAKIFMAHIKFRTNGFFFIFYSRSRLFLDFFYFYFYFLALSWAERRQLLLYAEQYVSTLMMTLFYDGVLYNRKCITFLNMWFTRLNHHKLIFILLKVLVAFLYEMFWKRIYNLIVYFSLFSSTHKHDFSIS